MVLILSADETVVVLSCGIIYATNSILVNGISSFGSKKVNTLYGFIAR